MKLPPLRSSARLNIRGHKSLLSLATISYCISLCLICVVIGISPAAERLPSLCILAQFGGRPVPPSRSVPVTPGLPFDLRVPGAKTPDPLGYSAAYAADTYRFGASNDLRNIRSCFVSGFCFRGSTFYLSVLHGVICTCWESRKDDT